MKPPLPQNNNSNPVLAGFWAYPSARVMEELKSSATGITNEEAAERKRIYGANTIKKTVTTQQV